MHKNCLWLSKNQPKPEIYWIFVACLLGLSVEKTFHCNKHNEKAVRAFKVSTATQIY